MIPMDPSEYLLEDFARRLAEQRTRMQEAQRAIRYAHSRTGSLARFLQRMADRIDPTGEARMASPRLLAVPPRPSRRGRRADGEFPPA